MGAGGRCWARRRGLPGPASPGAPAPAATPFVCAPLPAFPGLGALAGWRWLGTELLLGGGEVRFLPRPMSQVASACSVPPSPLGAASPDVSFRESSERTVPAPAPPPLRLPESRALSSGGLVFVLIHSFLVVFSALLPNT